MKPFSFQSEIQLKIEFQSYPDDCEKELDEYTLFLNKIKNIVKQLGFNISQLSDTSNEYYICKSVDNILENITQRSRFVMKHLFDETCVEILDYKIIAVLVDSNLNDSIFPLKGLNEKRRANE